MPTAVISGANRGIGLEYVKQLLDHGYTVYAGYRSDVGGLAAIQTAELHINTLDVADDESVSNFALELPDKVDLLINNAGVGDGRWPSVEMIDATQSLEVLNINSIGPVRLTQAVLPKMQHSELSKVAMISSLMGSIEDCMSGRSYAYRASKSALNMFGMAMKNELLKINVSVLLLHPGWVQTDMGGPNATIDCHTSVSEMLERIGEQTLEMSGRFVQYDGEKMPW